MVMDTRLSDPMVGRLLEGRYAVESFIAHGGMATVYLATDTRLDRRVAVKVMHAHLSDDPNTVARFEREARAAARLSSPEIVAIYDQGTDSGRAFLVMEYVPGVNLRHVIRDRGRLNPGEALAVMDHVVSALATAHLAGLVHRDVKPENVLVTADGRVKLADFGLARAVAGSTVTTTGSVLLGTAAYLSPEQFLHGTADARSDVYSAGVLLFELLTGAPPYVADNPNALLQRHVNEDVPRPSTKAAGIAPQLDALVTWATARDPNQRPADAGEFHAALIDVRDKLGLHDGVPALPISATTTLPAPNGSRRAGTVPTDTTQAFPGGLPPVTGTAPVAKRRRRRRWPLLTALLVIIVACAAVAGWWFADGRYTQVPGGLVNDTRPQADHDLRAAGLHAHWLAPQHSAIVPTGEVIAASPQSGRILHGGTVDLTLSLGKVTHSIPSLEGKPRADAVAALEALDISVSNVQRVYSNSITKGLAISTDPPASTTVTAGSSVVLTVSKGQDFVPIPTDLSGETVATAESELGQAGFRFKEHDVFSDDVDKGLVISVLPDGATAVKGSLVKLTVSKGQQLFEVPDVTRDSLTTAIQTLQEAGFKPVAKEIFPGGPGVVDTEPAAGAMEPHGTRIEFGYF
jgi:beta-lactam-binding protein with PASTA domain/tRNA A-37 threonylcarbamoyl transferase component Bud32